jgi:hypothetical protein
MTEKPSLKAAIFSNGKIMGGISSKNININRATGMNVHYNITLL